VLTPLPYNLRGDEMTEKNEQQVAGLASDLNSELYTINDECELRRWKFTSRLKKIWAIV
jgi:hypothetical protein